MTAFPADLPDPGRHSIRFPDLNRVIHTEPGETIFQGVRRHGLRIVGACGGRGTCGSCMIRVVRGTCHDLDGTPYSDHKRWIRACRALPQGNCTVEVAPRSLAPVVRAEAAAGDEPLLPLAPAVRWQDVRVPPAALDDPRADLDRLAAAVPDLNGIDLMAARVLPDTLRAENWTVSLRLRGGELIGAAPAGAPAYGLAVDLGTTNAAAFLIDLRDGRRVATLGIENPQVAWGADLISRINHAVAEPGAADRLRAAAVEAIAALAHDLCHAAGAAPADIVDAAVVGNTAMHHLLLGLPVRQLGRAPFVAAVRQEMDVLARDLGLSFAPGARVHFAANIGGFVGSDHVASLLATDHLWRSGLTTLVMDIGTNTELSLIHDGRILSASCPSGPALEGGHISCGMRAAEGAIERVRVEDGRLSVATIGGKPAIGVCGSGILDAMAALRAAGLTEPGGRIQKTHPDVTLVDGKPVVVLAPEVHISQADIRAVQLAKAAIRAGVLLLCDEAGIGEQDIALFVIAGAFGAYIDVASGIAMGLFPDLPLTRFTQVGNAAGLGARRMVASLEARADARRLAAEARYVELSSRDDFQKTFIDNIKFPAQGTVRRAS